MKCSGSIVYTTGLGYTYIKLDERAVLVMLKPTDLGMEMYIEVMERKSLRKYYDEMVGLVCIPEGDIADEVRNDILSLLADRGLSRFDMNWCLERSKVVCEDMETEVDGVVLRAIESFC